MLPENLHVRFLEGANAAGPVTPRAYTLTHSDATGELFLTIGQQYDLDQISGFYTHIMRDEVLAKWEEDDSLTLHVHCHVSGGLVVGSGRWREAIFRQHLPDVLRAFWWGDQPLIRATPQMAQAAVVVHFHARQKKLNRAEIWGRFEQYSN